MSLPDSSSCWWTAGGQGHPQHTNITHSSCWPQRAAELLFQPHTCAQPERLGQVKSVPNSNSRCVAMRAQKPLCGNGACPHKQRGVAELPAAGQATSAWLGQRCGCALPSCSSGLQRHERGWGVAQWCQPRSKAAACEQELNFLCVPPVKPRGRWALVPAWGSLWLVAPQCSCSPSPALRRWPLARPRGWGPHSPVP